MGILSTTLEGGPILYLVLLLAPIQNRAVYLIERGFEQGQPFSQFYLFSVAQTRPF